MPFKINHPHEYAEARVISVYFIVRICSKKNKIIHNYFSENNLLDTIQQDSLFRKFLVSESEDAKHPNF